MFHLYNRINCTCYTSISHQCFFDMIGPDDIILLEKEQIWIFRKERYE